MGSDSQQVAVLAAGSILLAQLQVLLLPHFPKGFYHLMYSAGKDWITDAMILWTLLLRLSCGRAQLGIKKNQLLTMEFW
jgi:hypothetical protein